jgi:hypothetical protein
LIFSEKSIREIIKSPSFLPKFCFADMGGGRQGVAGNGHASRVWKGDGYDETADTPNTEIGFIFWKENLLMGAPLRLVSRGDEILSFVGARL